VIAVDLEEEKLFLAKKAGADEVINARCFDAGLTHIVTSLKEVVKIYAISKDRSELLLANGVGGPADPKTGRPDSAGGMW
jgi:Zn-dependent alcohol dehydrogenase